MSDVITPNNLLRIVAALMENGGAEGSSVCIRVTDETPKRASVIDYIMFVTGLKRDTAGMIVRRLLSAEPEIKLLVGTHQFLGQGQRPTPVASVKTLVLLHSKIPVYGGRLEKPVSDRIAATKPGGMREFRMESGVADVVTNDEVIEVKHYHDWKAAIGQALVYGIDSRRSPCVHLFAWDNEQDIFDCKLQRVRRYFKKLKIKLTTSIERKVRVDDRRLNNPQKDTPTSLPALTRIIEDQEMPQAPQLQAAPPALQITFNNNNYGQMNVYQGPGH